MQMHRAVFVSAVLAAALIQACAADSADSSEDLVLTLTEKNFDEALAAHSFLVVEFYAPWCGHCKHLEPEYKKAASVLAEQKKSGKYTGQAITLAKVDATVEKALGTKFEVRGFPTLKIFEGGSDKPSDYEGPRDADGIVTFLKGRAGPASTEVKTEEEAKELIEESPVIVVYTDSDVDGWLKFSQSLRGKVVFVHTSSEAVKKAFGVEQKISVVKKFDEKLVGFDGTLSEQDKLVSWINLHRVEVGMAIQKGDQAAMKAVFEDDTKPNLFLFLATSTTPSGTASLSEFKKSAMKIRGKAISGYFEFPNFPEAFDHFGLKAAADKGDLPVVLIEDRKSSLRYKMDSKKITAELVDAFYSNFNSGKLQPFLKSEEPPTENDGPVRTIVASTFESEVSKAGRWVLLEAYAPWCGHCKKLVPIYEEVGKAFAGQGVTIAKVDATANDLPQSLNITGFPTILLFKGDGSKPEVYNGERNWKKITAFVSSWSGVQIAAGYSPSKDIEAESAAAGGETFPIHMRIIGALAEDYQVPFMEEGRTVPGLYVFALVLFLLFVASISLVIACLSRDPPSEPVAKAPPSKDAKKSGKKD
jgi:protein disulfide-isomerase A1